MSTTLLGSPLLEQGKGQHSRHFHQLFHQLRLRQSRALNSTTRKGKLGHFDNLLGNRRNGNAKERVHIHWLFHHLQHRDIESLHELEDATVLHHCPLRLHLDERCWPRPRGKSRLSP